MSTTTVEPCATFEAGELVVITGEDVTDELHGKTATVIQAVKPAGTYTVKVLDGPVVLVRAEQIMDAAEFWEREEAHR